MEAEELLQKMKSGDVVLTNSCKGIQWGSMPIRLANFSSRGYSKRGWTHAALYAGEGKVVEAFPGGIVERDFIENYFNGQYKLLVLRHKNLNNVIAQQIVDYCKNKEGHKYDFKALIYFVLYNFLPQWFHFLFENKIVKEWLNIEAAFFCSELVASGFLFANLYCFERPPHQVMPINFYNSFIFDVIEDIDPTKDSRKWWSYILDVFFAIFYFVAIVILFLLSIIIPLVSVFVLAYSLGKKKKMSNEEKNN